MDEQLAEIRTTLQHGQVLSRDDLADRLGVWQSMGLPDGALSGVKFRFGSIAWNRPVFGEVTGMEPTDSKIAYVENSEIKQEMVFDPEFLVFGPKDPGSHLRLAGMPPWINDVTRHGRHCIVPFNGSDLLGKLFQGMARLGKADFLCVHRECIASAAALPTTAVWLLFCTHPLREVEHVQTLMARPFLTYYAFSGLAGGALPTPLNAHGADAAEVHEFLHCVEQHALKESFNGMSDAAQIEEARECRFWRPSDISSPSPWPSFASSID